MSNSPLVTYRNPAKYHGGPRKNEIDRVSIHVLVAQWTAKQGCDYFANIGRKASPNYVVGHDGSIGLSVDESNRSYCTSSASNDNRAITIETASDTKHPYAVTDEAYEALLDLLTDICKRNGKTKLIWLGDKAKTLAYKPAANEMVLTVHRWFAAKACPGDYLYERHGAIAAEVTKRLGGSASTTAKKPATEEKKETTVKIAGAKSKDSSAAKGVKFQTTASILNVRSSASQKSNSNIIKTVRKGTKVTWYGYYTGDWYYVMFEDKSVGYVHKNYLVKA